MLTSSSVLLGGMGWLPIRPVVRKHKFGAKWHNRYSNKFWKHLQEDDFRRTSFWVSDFKHRYLIKTGRDFQGPVPQTAAAGAYPYMTDRDAREKLRLAPLSAERETRALPMMPLSARVVYERRMEAYRDYLLHQQKYRRVLHEVRETEFFNWYSRVQRVRGRWCREQGIASRGIYSPAVDAAEIWG